MQPWASIASLAISLLALAVSALSLSVAWRKDRREVKAQQPTAYIAAVEPIDDQPGWYDVELRIENRAAVRHRCVGVSIRRPWRAKGLLYGDAHQQAPSGGFELRKPLPAAVARRAFAMDVPLLKSGSRAPHTFGIRMGPGDDHIMHLLVLAPPSIWSRALSMRVNLVEMSPTEERKRITVRRTLTDASRTVRD